MANSTFIVGSILFYPHLPKYCELTGIWLFILGSGVFLFAPMYDIYRAHGTYQVERKRTATLRVTLNGILESELIRESTVSDATPVPANLDRVSIMQNIQTEFDELDESDKMNNITFIATCIICCMYICGSLLFVVGSVMFLRQFYSRDSVIAVNIFIFGSVLFFLATMTTSIITVLMRSLRLCFGNKSTRGTLHDNNVKSTGGVSAKMEEV